MGQYYVRTGFPSLTPMYGLGSYGRTGAAVLISSPRCKIGTQGRIYGWMQRNGRGPQYLNFLKNYLSRSPPANGYKGFGP